MLTQDQSGIGCTGESQSDSGYNFKTESTGLAEGLDVECESKRGVEMISKLLACARKGKDAIVI